MLSHCWPRLITSRGFRSLQGSSFALRHAGQPQHSSVQLSLGSLAVCPSDRSSSSSTRWKNRQGRDSFARDAKVQGLKSRAAFKLLEIDAKYRLFKKGQTVVDLGYAPGSWSQVAAERTKPGGRIVGIDIIPAQPPKGVSTIQGNFLSKAVQEEVKRFVADPDCGRVRREEYLTQKDEAEDKTGHKNKESLHRNDEPSSELSISRDSGKRSVKSKEEEDGKVVDIVLSDMCEPWLQTTGFWKRSLSDPYSRMMNTSGITFKDHAGSMDLCAAALLFSFDTLKTGGHFVCKFYQGGEDRKLEAQLRKLFAIVHREKPDSSRSESKEAFFVALRRKRNVKFDDVFPVTEGSELPE